jgi:hypothetical protein
MLYVVHSAYTQGKLLQIKQHDFNEAGLADILMLFFIIQTLDSAFFFYSCENYLL